LENTLNPDDATRRAAENNLQAFKQANFAGMLQTLTVVLSNESVSATSRVVASTYIKNALSGRSQQFKDAAKAQWESVDASLRETIKTHILRCLNAADSSVSNSTSQLISTIALLELPAGRWPDLIQNLASACAGSNPERLKASALKTLGYICEEIDEASITDKVPIILNAVAANLGADVKNVDLRINALTALQNLVFCLSALFQNKPQRDMLMNIVLQNCTIPDSDVKKTALAVLTDIISEYYPYISDYMQTVFNLTIPLIEKCEEEDEVIMQAIELWISIGDTETDKFINEEEAKQDGTVVEDIDKSRRYIEGALMPLLKALFVPLTKQDEDSEDDTEWNVPHAAATCINVAAGCVAEKIIPPILQIFQMSMNPDWHFRDAATVAFGSILDGPPTESLQPYLSDPKLLSLFIQHMKDPSVVVRSSTAWTLGRMCELHVGVVITDKARFEAIYEAFKQGLTDVPRVATICMWGLMVLAESLDEFLKGTRQVNPLSSHFTELVTLLFQSGEKPGCPTKQRKGAYQALGAIVHCSSDDNINDVGKVTMMCLERLTTMTAATSFPDKKDADELEALVSGLMAECVSKLDNRVSEIADRVCATYLTLYSKAAGASAQEEAVLGLGTFSMAMGVGVERYADQICRVIQDCISKPGEVDVCKCSVGTLGDVARSLEGKFSRFVGVFVPALFHLLATADVDRVIFAPVMSTLGDIAQNAPNEFKEYIPQIIGVVQQAMACKVNMSDDDDRDFLFELQEECFACIAGIQVGLSNIQQSQFILSYSGGITQCINFAYQNLDRPESLSNAIVGAICDLVMAAGPKCKEVMCRGGPWEQFPNMITTILQNAQDAMTKDNCKSAIDRIQQNFQA